MLQAAGDRLVLTVLQRIEYLALKHREAHVLLDGELSLRAVTDTGMQQDMSQVGGTRTTHQLC